MASPIVSLQMKRLKKVEGCLLSLGGTGYLQQSRKKNFCIILHTRLAFY